jgi:hypothetical protein
METQKVKSKISEIVLKAGKTLLFICIFTLGYIACDIYHRAKKEPGAAPSEAKVTKTIGKVSVAINERNELMIIDRTDGSYEIYQDSIGRCIFNLYANSIQSKYEGQ